MVVRIEPGKCDNSMIRIFEKNTTKIGMNHKIKYDGESFKVQSPICEILEITDTTIKVQFTTEYNIEHARFFQFINEMVNNFVSLNYSKFQFVSTVAMAGPFVILELKKVSGTTCFDIDKHLISIDTLSKDDLAIFLLETKGIWANHETETTTMKWSILQVLKYNRNS